MGGPTLLISPSPNREIPRSEKCSGFVGAPPAKGKTKLTEKWAELFQSFGHCAHAPSATLAARAGPVHFASGAATWMLLCAALGSAFVLLVCAPLPKLPLTAPALKAESALVWVESASESAVEMRDVSSVLVLQQFINSAWTL